MLILTPDLQLTIFCIKLLYSNQRNIIQIPIMPLTYKFQKLTLAPLSYFMISRQTNLVYALCMHCCWNPIWKRTKDLLKISQVLTHTLLHYTLSLSLRNRMKASQDVEHNKKYAVTCESPLNEMRTSFHLQTHTHIFTLSYSHLQKQYFLSGKTLLFVFYSESAL